MNYSVSVNFILHTDPRTNPPEFTVACRSQGGPVTDAIWRVDENPTDGDDPRFKESQLILNTSSNSVYDNRLHVRGRINGTYSCHLVASGLLRAIITEFKTLAVTGM